MVRDLSQLGNRREVVVISPFQFEEPGELFPGSSANHELVLVKRPDHLVLPLLLVVDVRLRQDGDGEILVEEHPRRYDLVLVLLHRFRELVSALLELAAAGVQKGPSGVAGNAVDVVLSGESGNRLRRVGGEEDDEPRGKERANQDRNQQSSHYQPPRIDTTGTASFPTGRTRTACYPPFR